jgi:hypothetical protein
MMVILTHCNEIPLLQFFCSILVRSDNPHTCRFDCRLSHFILLPSLPVKLLNRCCVLSRHEIFLQVMLFWFEVDGGLKFQLPHVPSTVVSSLTSPAKFRPWKAHLGYRLSRRKLELPALKFELPAMDSSTPNGRGGLARVTKAGAVRQAGAGAGWRRRPGRDDWGWRLGRLGAAGGRALGRPARGLKCVRE